MVFARRTSPSSVRAAWFQQHAVHIDPHGYYAVMFASGPGRLWWRMLAASLDGFAEAAHGRKPLEECLRSAQNRLRAQRSMWVETTPMDVMCVAMRVEHFRTEVVTTGGMRAYVVRPRASVPERMTPRDGLRGGLFTGELAESATQLGPQDAMIIGSDPSFSAHGIERFQERFLQYRQKPTALTERALDGWIGELMRGHEQAGTGAAVCMVAP